MQHIHYHHRQGHRCLHQHVDGDDDDDDWQDGTGCGKQAGESCHRTEQGSIKSSSSTLVYIFGVIVFSLYGNNFKGMVFITTMITIYSNIWAVRLKPEIHLFWGRHLT